MKVCVTMVGVCRPSFERIKQNIESNIAFFSNNYKEHTFTFVVLSYINVFHDDLSKFCNEIGIEAYFIPHIEDSAIDKHVKKPNWYRLFYSMNYILDKIPKDIYDCIIRLRLDTEIKVFELYNTIDPTKYYTINEGGHCSDNIGYANENVMRKVWSLNNYKLKAINAEQLVYKSIKQLNYFIKHFKFHFILYQSTDAIFDGVVQWSRRSREWIYDGKKYMINDI